MIIALYMNIFEFFLKGLYSTEFNIFNLISQFILVRYYFSVFTYIKNY